jgi:hypothetical protein
LFRIFLILTCLGASACSLPVPIERSPRNQIAIVSGAEEVRLAHLQYMRLRQGQVLVPVRVGGVEEFCTLTRAYFNASGLSYRMCLRDTNGDGRLDRAYPRNGHRGPGLEVDVAYSVQQFPCESCDPRDDDLHRITDNGLLAAYSIAPSELQHFVRLALSSDKTFDALIQRVRPNDTAEARRVVEIATRDIRDRVAMARCTGLFSPGAALLMPFGAWIAMAAAGEERICIDEYIRTGEMPPMDRPQIGEPGSPTT